MAVDEALLVTSGSGNALPALRLYSWEPACLSLGLAQPYSDVDASRLAANGWDCVRRPTGGRAILHTDELTYSVTGPYSEARLAGSVLESYLTLSKALVEALSLLGVQVTIQHPGAASSAQTPAAAVCFEVPSTYEITFDGKKLIGSAQARRREGILQHGSLPLTGDLTRITRVLRYEDDAVRENAAIRLCAHALTVEEALGRPVDWDTAAAAFAEAFSRTLNLNLVPTILTAEEEQLAREIFERRYGSDAWNKRI